MKFISIVKPGIIFGNAITVIGGYFLASHAHLSLLRLLLVLIGMSLVMASGCTLNNVIDRDIDSLMERTRNRVLARGLLSVPIAVAYALLLGSIGCLLLYISSNLLTALVAFTGWFVYVCLYSMYFKRHSLYGTAVGGIAGAIPPVVGYCSVSNQLDSGAAIVFLILFFWQIPHSYAIAIYRLQDYAAANIPVLPVRKGIAFTKQVMLLFVAICAIVGLLPSVFADTGWLYAIVAALLGLAWMIRAIKGFTQDNSRQWARGMFLFSIIYISAISIMMID